MTSSGSEQGGTPQGLGDALGQAGVEERRRRPGLLANDPAELLGDLGHLCDGGANGVGVGAAGV